MTYVSEGSLLRRQLEIAAFLVLMVVALMVATVLVPRTHFPRYLGAWMLFLFARSLRELGVEGRVDDGSMARKLFIVLEALALFVFGHLLFVGFLTSNWTLFLAAAVGVVVVVYSLTEE